MRRVDGKWGSALQRPEIKAFLFDLDGTLLDTTPLIYASFRHTLQAVLGRIPSDTEIHAQLGQTLLAGMSSFSSERAQELMDVYRRFNIANHETYVQAFPGAATALRQLRLDDMRLGLVTSKRRDVALLGLDITGLTELLDTIVCENDTDRHKPHPEPIWLACKQLQVSADQCVYLGDSPADMLAAKNAGCIPVAVAWSQFDQVELYKAGAVFTLEKLEDLPQMEDLCREREPLLKEVAQMEKRCSD